MGDQAEKEGMTDTAESKRVSAKNIARRKASLHRVPSEIEAKLHESPRLHETENILFDLLCDPKENLLSLSKFWQALELTGLRRTDPRLADANQRLSEILEDSDQGDVLIDKPTFRNAIQHNIFLINKAFKKELVIPEFTKFCRDIDAIYEKCRNNDNGQPADYIPQLARVDRHQWAVSLCTVDGQRYSRGPSKVAYCCQSCSKPLNYAIALSDLGSDVVHKYVGQEPSGRSFNEMSLDRNNKPHNPMINSGAIVTTSLLKPGLAIADRFDSVCNSYKRLAGGEFIGFNNAVYLSERETADRNFALGYYMRENKCFPPGTNLTQILEFYFQLCSIEINAESGALIAATLANGGICPTTGERVVNGEAVRNTLSLMHSCGMYDYSGQFAFKVGLPAKSGVAGCILLVVPKVMGICTWAPPLDVCGNSCKGIQFCEELVNTFNFHNYDDLYQPVQKADPRKRKVDLAANTVVNLLFGAASGDVSAVRRFALCGMDMNSADYDGRTALHLAAAEGHIDVVQMLLERCGVRHDPKDRWGFEPIDDARRFGHDEVVEYLEDFSAKDTFQAATPGSPPVRDFQIGDNVPEHPEQELEESVMNMNLKPEHES